MKIRMDIMGIYNDIKILKKWSTVLCIYFASSVIIYKLKQIIANG